MQHQMQPRKCLNAIHLNHRIVSAFNALDPASNTPKLEHEQQLEAILSELVELDKRAVVLIKKVDDLSVQVVLDKHNLSAIKLIHQALADKPFTMTLDGFAKEGVIFGGCHALIRSQTFNISMHLKAVVPHELMCQLEPFGAGNSLRVYMQNVLEHVTIADLTITTREASPNAYSELQTMAQDSYGLQVNDRDIRV
jgi:hypothetical protein